MGFSIHLAKQNYYVDIDSFLIRLSTGVLHINLLLKVIITDGSFISINDDKAQWRHHFDNPQFIHDDRNTKMDQIRLSV